MAKFVCTVCGYVFEGEAAPEFCPVCKAPASKFTKQEENMTWAAEHVVGVAQGVSEDILADLRANFQGECSEVGMYLAMARVAHREGYPEIGLYWEKAAYEEAEHAAKFAELLGEVVTDSSRCALKPRTVQPPVSSTLQSAQRPQISMLSTTPFTKWPATKPATARRSQVSLRDILVTSNRSVSYEI